MVKLEMGVGRGELVVDFVDKGRIGGEGCDKCEIKMCVEGVDKVMGGEMSVGGELYYCVRGLVMDVLNECGEYREDVEGVVGWWGCE